MLLPIKNKKNQINEDNINEIMSCYQLLKHDKYKSLLWFTGVQWNRSFGQHLL